MLLLVEVLSVSNILRHLLFHVRVGSISARMSSIRQIFERIEKNKEAYHLFIGFEKAYDAIKKSPHAAIFIVFTCD